MDPRTRDAPRSRPCSGHGRRIGRSHRLGHARGVGSGARSSARRGRGLAAWLSFVRNEAPMTDVKPGVDLRPLTRERAAPRPPRRLFKFLIPIAILVAFGAVLATNLKDFFGKVVDVTVIRPKSATGAGGEAAGSVALQAAGWVEPEPFAVRVTALASGVVKELLVLESDVVKAGDPVARLIDE